MMKKLLMLALALVLLTGTACAAVLPSGLTAVEEAAFEGDLSLTGVVTLPESVTSVGSRAFAATGLHALVVPEGAASVASDVLADGQAAYLMLLGSDTALPDGEPQGVAYTFGTEGGSASDFFDFYPLESLVEVDGLYYSIDEWEALPLCAVDGAALSGTVTVPKTVGDVPVQTIATLSLRGMSNVTELLAPDYLTIPAGMPATAYEAMNVAAPVPDVTEVSAGDPVVFTTEASGMYGEPVYLWTFTSNGLVYSDITSEPTASFYPTEVGELTACVTVIDMLNDEAISKESVPVTVTEPQPVYRAVLVGNVYSGESAPLAGCDTDVTAMHRMLSNMNSTPYQVSSYIDLSATGVTSAISSVFSSARPCDTSLFYFSGHGTSNGYLVGTGATSLSPSQLRACLDQIPGTKIVIIDACYSGSMIGRSIGASPSDFNSAFISSFSSITRDNLAANGYIVLTSCSSTQLSQTLTDGTISFGAFTYGLCYGSGYDEWNQCTLPRMSADQDGNGQITLSEAYGAACERVAWLGSMVDLNQSAQYYGSGSHVLWATTASYAPPLQIAAPVADVTEVKAGQPVVFTTEVSGAIGGEMYEWTFVLGDEEYWDLTSEPCATFFPEQAGQLTASMIVTDPQEMEAASAASEPVTVYPLITCEAPVSDIIAVKLGEPVIWTVNASNVCEPAFYEWAIHLNGTDYVEITTEPSVTFWPETAGDATVSVTIQDAMNDACTSEVSEAVTICEKISVTAPIADAAVVKAGTPVTFMAEATGVYGAAEYMWAISCGETVYTEITTEPMLVYIPENAGSITALVGVRDELSDECTSEVSEAVTVCERLSITAPVADAAVVKAGTPVTFMAEAANVYGAAEYMWAISCGEMVYTEITTEPMLVYTPENAGSITALIGVRDELNDECTSEVSEAVTICEKISITAPFSYLTEVTVGDPIVFEADVSGVYGEAAYQWHFTIDGELYSAITAESVITYMPMAAGQMTVSVTVVDDLMDQVTSDSSEPVTVLAAVPVYRAMLVGNIYSGQSNELAGCDTDVAAMKTMLSAMTGTPYQISSYIDLSANGITSAIMDTFSGARSCDVSLFHYSGHGLTNGSLVGTGSTYLSVAELRACLDQIPGTKIIIIDACYSGNMIGKSVGGSLAADFTSAFVSGFSSLTRDNLATNGYIVMTACSSTQQSQSLSDGKISFGAFTYGVCYGSGFDEWNQTTLPRWFADADSNSAITLSEAYTYACKRVDYLASMVTMDQSAQYYGDDSFVLWSK